MVGYDAIRALIAEVRRLRAAEAERQELRARVQKTVDHVRTREATKQVSAVMQLREAMGKLEDCPDPQACCFHGREL